MLFCIRFVTVLDAGIAFAVFILEVTRCLKIGALHVLNDKQRATIHWIDYKTVVSRQR